MKKQWKYLKYKGKLYRKYMVSNMGDVVFTKGKQPLPQYNMNKVSVFNGSDYKAVAIDLGDNKKYVRVHRIVCETFNGKQPENKPIVIHKDGNKSNNKASNLAWATMSEASKNYLKRYGRKKYDVKTISKVKKLINEGYTNTYISAKVNMSDSNVSAIRYEYIHKDVLPQITFW